MYGVLVSGPINDFRERATTLAQSFDYQNRQVGARPFVWVVKLFVPGWSDLINTVGKLCS